MDKPVEEINHICYAEGLSSISSSIKGNKTKLSQKLTLLKENSEEIDSYENVS